MDAKLMRKEWDVESDDGNRNATIFVKRGKDGFEFSHCHYAGLSPIYTIEDWEFLNELSEIVLGLKC